MRCFTRKVVVVVEGTSVCAELDNFISCIDDRVFVVKTV